MCLILLALDAHPDYSLILAANRDEFYDRPTAGAAFWDRRAVGARRPGPQAGRTWLGIDRRGRFAAVTNYRQGQREGRGTPLAGPPGQRLPDRAERWPLPRRQVEREAARYNGFNLIAGDPRRCSTSPIARAGVRALGPGVYGPEQPPARLAVAQGDGGQVRTDRAPAGGGKLLPSLFATPVGPQPGRGRPVPRTGVSPEWERLLSSAFIATEDYGTRSSTVVLVGRDGVVRSWSTASDLVPPPAKRLP